LNSFIQGALLGSQLKILLKMAGLVKFDLARTFGLLGEFKDLKKLLSSIKGRFACDIIILRARTLPSKRTPYYIQLIFSREEHRINIYRIIALIQDDPSIILTCWISSIYGGLFYEKAS